MATVLQQSCPEMGAIRFHTYDNEARAIRRQEREFPHGDENDDTPKEEPEAAVDNDNTQAAEDERVFLAYMAELL